MISPFGRKGESERFVKSPSLTRLRVDEGLFSSMEPMISPAKVVYGFAAQPLKGPPAFCQAC